MLVVSFDYAEDVQVPSHCDQKGSLYFLSPLRLSLACETGEGSEETWNRRIHKCGSGVASMVLEFLRRRNCNFDNLIVFVDNTVSQNKNMYLFSTFSMISARKIFGCSSVRRNLLCAGHTKFSSDRCSGDIKRKFKHADLDTVLDVEFEITCIFFAFSKCAIRGL